jgi:hypothetical protein
VTNSTLTFFFVGMVGGLAPEIVRLYRLATQAQKFAFSPFYVIMSILFAALGGFIATLLPATTFLAAFYTGIATPTLITKVLEQGGKPGVDGGGGLKGAEDAGAQPASLKTFLRAL